MGLWMRTGGIVSIVGHGNDDLCRRHVDFGEELRSEEGGGRLERRRDEEEGRREKEQVRHMLPATSIVISASPAVIIEPRSALLHCIKNKDSPSYRYQLLVE